MIEIKPYRNVTARLRAAWNCRAVAFTRSRILFLLAGWLALVTPLRAENPPTYFFQIDSSDVPGGLEFYPRFVALDSSNNFYVSDAANSRIVKFSSGGTFLTQWGSPGTGNGQFDYPAGVAVDSSNNVYIADQSNSRIEKFNNDGDYLTQWGAYGGGDGQFSYPSGIAVDSSNNVYVADENNNRIEKFSSTGTYLTQWGGSGTNTGQLDDPVGIAVDSSNNVYVADDYNNRIEKFSSSGASLTQWGSLGSGNGQFGQPTGIAVDSSNNVYVADADNNRIEKFNNDGDYLTQWGDYEQFVDPFGVAVDSSGNHIFVAEINNERIQVFVYNTRILAPVITQQPANQSVAAGVTVSFGVRVVGTAPFYYQWSSNNVAVSGATDVAVILTNVSPSQSGNYSVLVTNNYGGAMSIDAVLNVVPSFVTTQPASGISASGAVLNGSVTVGMEDETVVWFDWGADTNYGNIAGATVVPGNDESNNASATLSGVPGNIYHYRLDAANDFGIVYGEDQLFTVGFAPTATTLAPINSANGSTLEGAVNPEGWDTTVYFKWFNNTTPGMDIGAGATLVNVSNFVPGLTPSIPYQYQVVASNALGTTFGQVFSSESAQANKYLLSGSETNITLNPGTYVITVYGAPGAGGVGGGLGAEMEAKFYFPTSATLTLLVGGGGGNSSFSGGGGGGSFVVEGVTPLVIAGGGGGGGQGYTYRYGNGSVSTDGYDTGSDGGFGGHGGAGGGGGGGGAGGIDNSGGFGGFGGGGGGGGVTESYGGFGGPSGFGGGGGGGYSGGGGGNYYGGGGGGSIIDSSAIAILSEVSGIASQDDPNNGEIIITPVPTTLGIVTTDAALVLTNGAFGFDVAGPSGSNVVIQASADLQTWIPLQTNVLGGGPLHFSDAQSPANVQRYYRAQLSR